MNKRIAVGKCVTVLYSCHAQLEKKKERERERNITEQTKTVYLYGTDLTGISLLCPWFH